MFLLLIDILYFPRHFVCLMQSGYSLEFSNKDHNSTRNLKSFSIQSQLLDEICNYVKLEL